MAKHPSRPLGRLLRPLQDFLRLEAAGGLVLMIAAAVAMVVANSPLSAAYEATLRLPIEVRAGSFGIAKPLLLWINDGLMAVFFFLVGMELKREVDEGHLASIARASLPAIAAVGGMAAPAVLYAAFNWGDAPAMRGWAVPTATDIAFALGVLSLLGKRVPAALKALLLSIAIFDDLGAIVVIAVFYTETISKTALGIAAICLVGLATLNRLGVNRTAPYLALGLPMWVAVLKSGVHATIAGVLLALFIPLRGETNESSEPLLRTLEHALHPWVASAVLPIFAFANAGVPLAGLSLADLGQPVPLGIVIGLFAGKQLGVTAFAWMAVRLGIAALPEGVSWRQIYGMALLCGIGFTMSLFIAGLAFGQGESAYQGLERLGILIGTLLSGLAGYFLLRTALPRRSA